jgi:hypothetical protein
LFPFISRMALDSSGFPQSKPMDDSRLLDFCFFVLFISTHLVTTRPEHI